MNQLNNRPCLSTQTKASKGSALIVIFAILLVLGLVGAVTYRHLNLSPEVEISESADAARNERVESRQPDGNTFSKEADEEEQGLLEGVYGSVIQQLEKRRSKTVNAINGCFDQFASSLKDTKTDELKALGLFWKETVNLLKYSKELSTFADEKLILVEQEISQTMASRSYSPETRRVLLHTLELQKESLLNYKNNVFPLITNKQKEFTRLYLQCHELIGTIKVIGREKAVSLIIEKVSEFQEIHFKSLE